ncbi:MAG: ABC transporter permease, partial [Burkholderiales bacterium]|nr:ABC transporter permease [Burkholderiales bacterium]
SGTDLIVGPRTGSIQLLLYSVFRIGNATNNIAWRSVQDIAARPAVEWMIPLSLGDQHRGFPVVATTHAYFEHFRYGDRQLLRIRRGGRFDALFDAVIGAEVADRLGYGLGETVVFSHGNGIIPGSSHSDKPFTVVGVLERTGTPVDRSIHISLEAMEGIHLDWVGGVAPAPGESIPAAELAQYDLTPREVTAFLLGLKRRTAVFATQRMISRFEGEPLMAVLPGIALDELWDVLGAGERGLLAMSGLVSLVSLAGLMAVILAGLNERRRELAILRAVGAGPRQMLALLAIEGALVTLCGVVVGALACGIAIALLRDWFEGQFGIALQWKMLSDNEWLLLGAVLAAGWLASLVPGFRAYRLSLTDGLQPRV